MHPKLFLTSIERTTLVLYHYDNDRTWMKPVELLHAGNDPFKSSIRHTVPGKKLITDAGG